jgi:chromate reductase, NAD(P)H dehydrogenase (quinone)
VPLYNQDLEDDFPETVINLKQTVEAADALVFSTPEYNGSILKNVIDWLSRP